MPFVTVGVFDDRKRKFLPQDINLENVNAIETDVTLMYGPIEGQPREQGRAYETRKVTLNGTHVYVHVDDIHLLRQ